MMRGERRVIPKRRGKGDGAREGERAERKRKENIAKMGRNGEKRAKVS